MQAVFKGELQGKDGQILRRSAHNHPSDISKMEYRMMEKEAKRCAAQNPMLPPRVILEAVCNFLAKKKQALPKLEQAPFDHETWVGHGIAAKLGAR